MQNACCRVQGADVGGCSWWKDASHVAQSARKESAARGYGTRKKACLLEATHNQEPLVAKATGPVPVTKRHDGSLILGKWRYLLCNPFLSVPETTNQPAARPLGRLYGPG